PLLLAGKRLDLHDARAAPANLDDVAPADAPAAGAVLETSGGLPVVDLVTGDVLLPAFGGVNQQNDVGSIAGALAGVIPANETIPVLNTEINPRPQPVPDLTRC